MCTLSEEQSFQMLENICPKIDPSQGHDITVDQLVLLRVFNLDGRQYGKGLPVRDTEVTHNEPFTHHTAKIEIEESGNGTGEGMAAGIFHRYVQLRLVWLALTLRKIYQDSARYHSSAQPSCLHCSSVFYTSTSKYRR